LIFKFLDSYLENKRYINSYLINRSTN
jgi:hypothetical protein